LGLGVKVVRIHIADSSDPSDLSARGDGAAHQRCHMER
jgi:hypothetical protein